MATGRINKKVLEHIAHINRETKQMQLVFFLVVLSEILY